MATVAPPARTDISDTYPNPNNADARVGFGKLWDYMTNLLGVVGSPATARTALGVAPRATRIDVASVAGTVDLTTNAPDTDDIRITGALAITKFTVAVGRVIRVLAGGAFTLTENANIVTNKGNNITMVAGQTIWLRATAADVVEVLGFYGWVELPSQATTSGLNKTFSGIPPTAKEMMLLWSGGGTSGTNFPRVRLGDSGGLENTSYIGSATIVSTGSSPTSSNHADAFYLTAQWTSATRASGFLHLKNLSGNTWVATGSFGGSNAAFNTTVAGEKTLSDVLTQIAIMSDGTTETLTAGTARVFYRD